MIALDEDQGQYDSIVPVTIRVFACAEQGMLAPSAVWDNDTRYYGPG